MKALKFASFALIALFLVSFVNAQTVDEVVTKHLDAIGGAANWKKVNTMKMEANINVQGNDIPVTIYQVNNKATKSEINFQGTVNYNIITTEGGWKYFPIMGQAAPEALSDEEIKAGQNQLDIQGELVDYKAKGHKVELVGKETVDGIEGYKLKVTRKNGSQVNFLIDAKTFYIVRATAKISANGQEIEQTSIMSNYTKLPEGIFVPMTLEGVGPAPIVVSKIEVNPKIEDAVFKVTQ
ncbi:hypothetical protein [Pollutibacter soli]|uniref:hypothetical protein n=1 Tax=Pollutibacter soli TaxID=3034157 RepID=UPI00301351FC